MVIALPGPSLVGLLVPSPAKRAELGTRRTDCAAPACAAIHAASTNAAPRTHTSAPMPNPPCNRFIIRSASATGGAARDSLSGASAPDRETAARHQAGCPNRPSPFVIEPEVTFVPKREYAFRHWEVRPIQAQGELREYATKAPVRGYQICIVTGAGGGVVTRWRAVASG